MFAGVFSFKCKNGDLSFFFILIFVSLLLGLGGLFIMHFQRILCLHFGLELSNHMCSDSCLFTALPLYVVSTCFLRADNPLRVVKPCRVAFGLIEAR